MAKTTKKGKKKEKKEKVKKPFWTENFPTLRIQRSDLVTELGDELNEVRNTLSNLWALSRKPGRAHYASEAFQCPRKTLARRRGVFPTDETSFDAMDTGVATEERVIAFYRNAGIFVPFSQQLRTTSSAPELEHSINGYMDCLIYEDEMFIPVEIKSAKDFDEMIGGWEGWLSWKPTQGHVAQLMCYLHFMQTFYPPHVGKVVRPPEYGYVHYYNKNREIHAAFRVDYDPKFFAAIVAYFQTIEELEKKENLPSLADSSDILMAFHAKGKPLDGKTYPCRWMPKGKASKDKEELTGTPEAGKCEFYSGCWKDKEFIYAQDVKEGDMRKTMDAILARQNVGK